jgi:hypothetical protein
VRILIISTTLTVVCVGAGAVLSSPVSRVAADVADGPGYHDSAAQPAASATTVPAVAGDERSSGRTADGTTATEAAYPSESGTPTPGASQTLPILPTEITSILPTLTPGSTPTGPPLGSPTGSASPSASASTTAAPSGTATATPTLGPTPTADPTGGDGSTAGKGGGDGGLVCVVLPILCG